MTFHFDKQECVRLILENIFTEHLFHINKFISSFILTTYQLVSTFDIRLYLHIFLKSVFVGKPIKLFLNCTFRILLLSKKFNILTQQYQKNKFQHNVVLTSLYTLATSTVASSFVFLLIPKCSVS